VNRARTALRNAATEFGTRHAQLVAQYPQQGHLGLDVYFMVFTVDVQFQHACILDDQKVNTIVNSPAMVNPVKSRRVWTSEGVAR
jgi:hypothetical protein